MNDIIYHDIEFKYEFDRSFFKIFEKNVRDGQYIDNGIHAILPQYFAKSLYHFTRLFCLPIEKSFVIVTNNINDSKCNKTGLKNIMREYYGVNEAVENAILFSTNNYYRLRKHSFGTHYVANLNVVGQHFDDNQVEIKFLLT